MVKIMVLDIETTDTDSSKGSIVEIGAVLLDSKTFDIEKAISKIIQEPFEFNEGAWIFWNSNLKPEMIKNDGVPIEEIRPKLQALLDEYITVAYNQKFDFEWLESRNFKIPKKGKDPMPIATEILKIPGFRGNYKWPKVQECLNYFKIQETEPHRALDDALLEAKIVIELLKIGKYEILESLALADSKEMKVMRYKAKIESYDHLIAHINEKKDFCLKALQKLEV